jgi:uncharacterized protein
MDVTVRDNPDELRYEALVDGRRVGEIRYVRRDDGVVELVHTDVDPSVEGGGVGSALVRGALDDVRSRGLKIIPTCPFVDAYLRRHPEYADLVA